MIIQFSHNGKELKLNRRSIFHTKHYLFNPQPSIEGKRYWNDLNDHKRKFISHPGWYIDSLNNTSPIKDQLWFWGEWEPQSKFELTGAKIPALPNAIHYPMLSSRGRGRHNTDPFVFGEHFYYTNCKQKQKGRGKKLLSLSQNSIIIFGSEKNNTKFLIDTVFVVDSSESMLQYTLHPHHYPMSLRIATLDLNGGLQNWHTLYRGKMFDFTKPSKDNLESTFCFVPCKLAGKSIPFEKPEIDWQKFKFQKPGAGTVLIEIKNTSEKAMWDDLVNELLKQGFYLGVKFDGPFVNDMEYFPEYIPKKKGC